MSQTCAGFVDDIGATLIKTGFVRNAYAATEAGRAVSADLRHVYIYLFFSSQRRNLLDQNTSGKGCCLNVSRVNQPINYVYAY